MTTIDVDTSPLQAAREWRGTSLIAVARSCGLPVSQAEALEEGDTSAFASVDEMIAAAVLYGASIGIGRDEAMALLDRTVSGEGVQVQLPGIPEDPGAGFSSAVQHRSARIATRGEQSSVLVPLGVVQASTPIAPEDGGVSTSLPTVDVPEVSDPKRPGGPTPAQAVAAAAEISLDTTSFSPDHGWDRPAGQGDLVGGVIATPEAGRASGFAARVGSGTFSLLERIVSSEKADHTADIVERALVRAGEVVRTGRERLRQNEHATLIVAMTGGAVLVAILVAIASSLGGSDEPAVNAGNASKPAAKVQADVAAEPKAVVKVAPMLPAGKITVDVFNAGSQKGEAKTVAADLKERGYRLGDVGNAKADYGGSMIIYPKGRLREARVLSNATGITTLDIAPGSSTDFTLIVV